MHRLRNIPATVVWFVLGAVGCASVMLLEPSLLEEGFAIDTASRMTTGEHLYRDVVAFTGPLPFDLLAILFRLFGEQILLARGVVVLLHGAATASVFSIARAARTGPFAHPAAGLVAVSPIVLFPLLSTFFYTTLSSSLTLIVTAAALRGTRSRRWAVAAGVGVALVALCKQTVGLALAPALALALYAFSPASSRFDRARLFVFGGLGVAAITIVTFLARGDLGVLFHSLVWLPLSFEPSFDLPYMDFWPPGRFGEAVYAAKLFYMPYFYSLMYGVWPVPSSEMMLFTQVLYAIPMLVVAATLLRRCIAPLSGASWFHFAALLALATNLVPRADWGHLVFVLPAALVQGLLLVTDATRRPREASAGADAAGDRRAEEPRTRARPLAWIAASLLLLVCAGGAAASLDLLYGLAGPPTFGPRVPLRPVNEGLRSAAVPNAIAYLRAHLSPGDPLFVARGEPLLYFATETRNPTPYGGLIPGMRAEQSRVVVEALRDLRYVVMSEVDQPVYTYYRDELPAVQAYLERHFGVVRELLTERDPPWLLVLEKSEDRGPAIFDLVDERGDGRPFVRESRPGDASHPAETLPRAEPFDGRLANRLNRRFLAFRLGAYGGGIDFDLALPEGALFQADIGYADAATPFMVFDHPSRSRLRVSIARRDEPDRFVPVFESDRQLYPLARPKRWTPVEADLSAYGGERVVLRLELIRDDPIPRNQLGWFGSPRVTVTSGARPVPPARTRSGSRVVP